MKLFYQLIIITSLSFVLLSCQNLEEKSGKPINDSTKKAENLVKSTFKFDKDNYLITDSSAGPLKKGMSLKEIQTLFTSKQLAFDESKTMLSINDNFGNLVVMVNLSSENTAIGFNVFSPKFSTEKGIKQGSNFAEVKKVYNIVSLTNNREDLPFTNYAAENKEHRMFFFLAPEKLDKLYPESLHLKAIDDVKVTSIFVGE